MAYITYRIKTFFAQPDGRFCKFWFVLAHLIPGRFCFSSISPFVPSALSYMELMSYLIASFSVT